MDIKKIGIIAVIIIAVIAVCSFLYISMNTTNTILEINCEPIIQNGDYIYVLLKDDYRNVIPDQPIDLKILDDSGWAHHYNVTTDELGRGYIQVLSFDNGNYTVHATYNGTIFNKAANSNYAFAIDDGYSY